MKNVYIWTGTRPSDSATLLAKTLGVRKIKCKNSKYIGKQGHTIINWGCTDHPPGKGAIINRPLDVRKAVNKLTCFNILKAHDVSIPEYTTDINLVDRAHTYLARHNLTGSGGDGITIINPGDPVPRAPLYVKYIPKKYEVRIHVVKDTNGRYYTFDWQQKMNALGKEQEDWKIRSHDNGFVFARHNTTVPMDALESCKIQAEKAVKALGLDFGACDTIYNERHGKAYVLEVNTAPGIENTTAENYAKMFKALLGDRHYVAREMLNV